MGLGVVLCFSILIYIFFCISVVVLRLICHSYWLVLCLLVRICLYCSWCPLYFGCSACVVLLIDCSAIYCFLSFKVHFLWAGGVSVVFFLFLKESIVRVF